jgi:serine protease Do
MQSRSLVFIALVGWGVGLGPRIAQGQPLQLTRTAGFPTVSYLGVATQDVSPERAKSLKLPEVSGVEITKLDPTSPAAAAGIKMGDVVMQYNAQRVENGEQFARMVRETPPGREVKLQIYRDGAPQIAVAKIVLHPAMTIDGQLVPIQPRPQPLQGLVQDVPLNRMSWGIGALGAELESLEGQLADSFGAKDGGVLVRSVVRGSAAERAGLKAGDVITRVGDAKVTTPTDVSGRIRAGRGQSATLTLLRDHREMSLTIALDGSRPGQQ